ncbi:MAG TPA: alpha/beta hydrolase [Candidatus Acidoferrales bacterium]
MAARNLKGVLNLILTLLVGYAALLLLLRLGENRIIFLPTMIARTSGDWQPPGLPVEDVWLRTSDGVQLHAWWIPAPGAEFTFIAFHGNAGNITHRADVFRFLHRLPGNVLAVEYRGYGRSEGSPDEAGIYRDAQAAFDFAVKERGVAPRSIIAFGQSLGTTAAAELAATREIGGVVLEAPFPSAGAVARRVYPFLPGLGRVVKSKFETAAKLEGKSVPVLVVHCANDPVLAYSLGAQVYERAQGPKVLFRVEGYCHEEASLIAPEEYRAKLAEFFTLVKSAR